MKPRAQQISEDVTIGGMACLVIKRPEGYGYSYRVEGYTNGAVYGFAGSNELINESESQVKARAVKEATAALRQLGVAC